jgi:hypothetical protein
MLDWNIPESVSPNPGGGCAESGPGVLCDPGDRTSSFNPPGYDNDELGGLWKNRIKKIILANFIPPWIIESGSIKILRIRGASNLVTPNAKIPNYAHLFLNFLVVPNSDKQI